MKIKHLMIQQNAIILNDEKLTLKSKSTVEMTVFIQATTKVIIGLQQRHVGAKYTLLVVTE